jgi:hypothetical protein
MTKGELIKLLQEDKMSMNTHIDIYLDCTNDDKGILATSINEIKYNKAFKSLMIYCNYEEEY